MHDQTLGGGLDCKLCQCLPEVVDGVSVRCAVGPPQDCATQEECARPVCPSTVAWIEGTKEAIKCGFPLQRPGETPGLQVIGGCCPASGLQQWQQLGFGDRPARMEGSWAPAVGNRRQERCAS